MADINPTFSLYHRTLRQPSSGLSSIIGNFSGSRKSQEIVRATQTTLELWKFNKSTSEVSRLVVQNAYCNIRAIASFKVVKSTKDLILLTSDSGTLSIIEFDSVNYKFTAVRSETFYKTGVRRLSPGEYISVDPNGRAAMIGAIERNKLVYTFARDNSHSNGLVVMSPLEANRNHLLTYTMVAMDSGFENPIFAAIETDYSAQAPKIVKLLNYYEFDLGLNHVILSESETINSKSNHLVAIPGGYDGPSGVLVCSEGMIQYKCPFKPTHYAPIPTRGKDTSTKSIIVSSVVHKMKNAFFILLQNQFGDLFKVTLDYTTTQETKYDVIGNDVGPGMVTSIRIRYFDTIPICTSLLILKSGFLYADCEQGDQYIYQFEKLGNGSDEKEWNSEDYPDEQAVLEEENEIVAFDLKPFDNIRLVEANSSLSPMMDVKLISGDLVSSLPELYSITGSGPRSAIKVLHKSIPLSEIVTQELPSKIMKAFTCKIHKKDQYDRFIVLSFFDGSIILSIGEEVEEAENSGFIDTITTLDACQTGSDSIVQIHATGLKQIFYSEDDEPVKSIDWNPPPGIEVLFSSCTNTQVALALSNGDVVYFETSPTGDALVEFSLHKEFNASITSISLGDIPKGRLRSPFIIVTCKDASIHVLSTDPKETMKTKYTTKLYSTASSTAITSFSSNIEDYTDEDEDYDEMKDISLKRNSQIINFVHVGLQNGIYVRYILTDEGELIKPNMKYVMASPLMIEPIRVTNKVGESVTVAAIRSLLSFLVIPGSNEDIKLIPLPIAEKFVENENEDEDEEAEETTYSKTYGCVVPLHSADVPQGLILAHGEKLTIASLPLFNAVDDKHNGDCQTCVINKLKKLDNIESIPMRYTPRAVCDSVNNEYKMSYIACSDLDIKSMFNKPKESTEANKDVDEMVTYGNIEDNDAEEFEKLQNFGYSKSTDGDCASCIHVFSTENCAIGQTIELLGNQTAHRLGAATLEHDHKVGDYLLVSTIIKFNPIGEGKKHEKCFIRVYHIEEDGSLQFVYKQEFPRPILAIHAFQGRVVLGFGDELGIYELGKLQMLRKSGLRMEEHGITNIVDIKSSGFRLFVSDIRSSVQIVLYQADSNSLVPVVDDCINRHITRGFVLDHDTIIVGDKFGTVTVLRNPVSNLEIEQGHGRKGNNLKDNIKFDMLMSFYVGDVIVGLFRGQIGVGGEDAVVYGGINGTIGVFSAVKTMKEVNFFRELEKLMRNVLQGMKIDEFGQHDSIDESRQLMLAERDILKFRSYYVPKRACIDGDVVEDYFNLDDKTKSEIAKALERTVPEIEAKIVEMKGRVGY